ncbi:Hypothetical protein KLENKIAIHU_1590 [Klenkia terrae]|nr:Hypothetical protein KLENKIAIHU_1590 [Klenkia terrae]
MAAVPLSALVLLAGCGGGDAEEAGATSSAAATSATSTSAPGTATPSGSDPEGAGGAQPSTFPADTSPDTGEATAGEGPTVVTALRVGDQDGFDRVVFEVSGSAAPGWDVAYVDAATAEGSGEPVDVPGTTFLRVTLTGITNPYEAPEVTEVGRGAYPGQGGPVQGVWFDSTFEGQALAYVGLDAERPFRVYALTGPSRIVVDVQD